jgi:putative transposase
MIVAHLGVNQLSATCVSKVGRELDVNVWELMEKPLDSFYPNRFVNASFFKVRDETRYINKALLVIIGVQTDDHQEVLAVQVADEKSLLEYLQESGVICYIPK